MSKKLGYRGYISSRPIRGTSFPHRVQNLVVRDYADRKELVYKLSATEYAMPGCYMMLSGILEELATLEGIILFSLFTLPKRQDKRFKIYHQIINQELQLHAALEDMILSQEDDINEFEDMIKVVNTLPYTPMEGYYSKSKASPFPSDFLALNL